MGIKQNSITTMFCTLLILIFASCMYTSKEITNTVPENISGTVSPAILTNAPAHGFFGVWRLEKVAVKSKWYNDEDITRNGDVIPIEPEDYIGSEVEYTSEFFRFDDIKIYSPKYETEATSVNDFNYDGRFHGTYPDVYEFIEMEKIQIDGKNDYDSFKNSLQIFWTRFEEEPDEFIPLGRDCVLLNEDNILVGVLGKVILARRVK
ncbi:MAG: hypothetical protein FWH04_07315 [Oscillospiraceae bacterium]|nr:hypothetical protein [Oscillospiraceae bacterium]